MIKRIKNIIRWKIIHPIISPPKVKGKMKIFCIGGNKTGTTSLKKAFEDLGFIVGHQGKAETFLKEYIAGDFEPIIRYCKSAQVFQDFPFSFPKTYKYLDKAYPGSKFILTVRDSPEQWYNSLTKFHAKRFGNGQIPTKEVLQNYKKIWKGYLWDAQRAAFSIPGSDPYHKETLLKHYEDYNNEIIAYFKDRPDDLLIINVSKPDSYQKLMKFLSIESPFTDFPWENQTSKIKTK